MNWIKLNWITCNRVWQRNIDKTQNTPISTYEYTKYYLQADGVACHVPPQTHPVPVFRGQPDREPVSDSQQPRVQGVVVPLQAQLGSGRVGRAVREGHPGPGDDHADVHAQSHVKEPRHGDAVLQRPVVLAAV